MRIITRNDQDRLLGLRVAGGLPSDAYFDGLPLPRETAARNWKSENAVHRAQAISDRLDSTRYFEGPQVNILRDDNRRVTWAAIVEKGSALVERKDSGSCQLVLCRISGARLGASGAPRIERKLIAEGDIWRYHIALDKFSGAVSIAWIQRTNDKQTLWLDGTLVPTDAEEPDFPFYAFSQPPIGHVATTAPPYSLLGYKCRRNGRVFIRKVDEQKFGDEMVLNPEDPVVGGVSFAVLDNKVVARLDVLKKEKLVPRLLISDDAAETFQTKELDISGYEPGFEVVPGYTKPVVDVGKNFHAPVIVTDGKESAALNYVLEADALVEGIRVQGGQPDGSLEVFPATLGNPNAYGDGVTDGYGLIMVLGSEGRLFTSNSSAGGIFFPRSAMLNNEMPLVAAFCPTECYESGIKPNYVNMDYLYLEADPRGEPISSTLYLETWDMPLPIPKVTATSHGAKVEVTVLSDADLEPGKVNFSFSDPTVKILDVQVTGLRSAVLLTDTDELKGKVLIFDVDTIFHRHYAESVVA
jgi:hypothetical protein